MRWQTALALPAAVAVMVAVGFIVNSPGGVEHPPQLRIKPQEVVVLPAVNAVSQPQALPRSLRGTHHGVRLLSISGELQVTSALKELFDYYLSALGEKSVSDIRALIIQDLERQLSDTALQQAVSIVDDYLQYKAALSDFEVQFQQQPDWSKHQQLTYFNERHQALIALQDQLLGAEVAQIFFAFDRRLDQYTLNKARIMNSDMSADGKQQTLVNLTAELPQAIQLQQQRNKQQRILAEIDRKDLSARQKFQQRAETVGEAAAQRLAQLDQQRAQWDQRLQQFQQQVADIKASGLAEEDYQQAYEKLLHQHFQPHEQVRAKALSQ